MFFQNLHNKICTNERIVGTSVHVINIITKSLKLYLDFQNVYYDIDADTIVDNVKTFNAFKITAFSWIGYINDFKQSSSLVDKFLSFFGSPEWEPRSS